MAIKVRHCLIAFVLLTVVVLACTLMGVSVAQPVAQDEVAISYNNFTKNFGTIYYQGAYTLDVGDRFIKFKRTLQDVSVSQVQCISYDNIMLTLTISAQYQYVPELLIPTVLSQFGSDAHYKAFLNNIVTNVILRQCGLFTTANYYENRGQIYNSMYDALISEFNNSTDMAVTIEFFQLINIAFPSDYQGIVQQKQLLIQTEITSLNNRTTQLINANTTLLQNEFSANVQIINAENQVAIIMNQANASYATVLNQWRQRMLTYLAIVNNLQLNQSQFLDYLSAEVVRQSTGSVISV